MFSAASNSRGAAIGIPMAVLFSWQFIVGLAPWTLEIMPWGLTNAGTSSGTLGNGAGASQLFSLLLIIATRGAWCSWPLLYGDSTATSSSVKTSSEASPDT
jgi:hypothetical protein